MNLVEHFILKHQGMEYFQQISINWGSGWWEGNHRNGTSILATNTSRLDTETIDETS